MTKCAVCGLVVVLLISAVVVLASGQEAKSAPIEIEIAPEGIAIGTIDRENGDCSQHTYFLDQLCSSP